MDGQPVVANLLDWDLEGWWFKPKCSHNIISAAVRPLSKVFKPTWLLGFTYFQKLADVF